MRALLAVAVIATAFPFWASAQTPTPTSTPSAEDAALLREIQGATQPAARASAAFSNAYNPAMSVNALFLGSQTTQEQDPAEPPNGGLALQEIELQMTTNVDPYFSANVILAFEEGEIDAEEAYVTPSWQPLGFSFRVGKMKVPFGRENTLHTHALPFVDRSLALEAVLGEEGLAEAAIEASWLSPLPWYSLVYVAALDGENDALFASPRGEDLAGFAGWKNVFDLTSDATLETGVSYAAGQDVNEELTQAGGAHVVVKWRPARAATTRSAMIAAEALYAHQPLVPVTVGDPLSRNVGGAYGYAQVQVARRWYAGARYDYLGFPAEEGATRRGSAIVVFAPTEFSAVRLQGSATKRPAEDELDFTGLLQLNVTLGAHPAHAY